MTGRTKIVATPVVVAGSPESADGSDMLRLVDADSLDRKFDSRSDALAGWPTDG